MMRNPFLFAGISTRRTCAASLGGKELAYVCGFFSKSFSAPSSRFKEEMEAARTLFLLETC